MRARTLGNAVGAIEALEKKILFSAPTTWSSRGPGGGGAFFAPSFSPYDANELFVTSDMSGLYQSKDLGASWSLTDFREVQGNRAATVNFTNDENVLYTLDYTEINGGSEAVRPTRSIDKGATWTPVTGWDENEPAYGLWADPTSASNLIVNDYGTLYFSSNGGQSFTAKFTAPNSGQGLHVGGVFFDGDGNIYVGSSAGLLVSNNNGASFALSSASGIPAGESILSFTGARENGKTRLMCVTADSGSVYNGVNIEEVGSDYKGIYSMDVGLSNWTAKTSGIPAGEYPHLISMARGDIDTAYVAGTNDASYPTVAKTINGGTSWADALHAQNNQNVQTGWQGQGGDRGWSFGETAMGFQVDPVDASHLAFTDFGYVHLSTDGGATWTQAYVNPADENPAGAPTPMQKAYHGVGLEDTSALWLTWADANNLVAGYTDIRGARSTDGGASWSLPSSLSLAGNTVYQISQGGANLYAATSNIHDIYQSTHLANSPIDGGTGSIITSSDKGATWTTLHNFGAPVVYTAIDPTNAQRMFASVADTVTGGIYVTTNLGAGAASAWTKLPAPPRTEGHPYDVVVLNDGTVVATYSGHRNPNFTPSSGVFVSTDHGLTWVDRTLIGAKGAPGMQYWTKDITIDPTDTNQNTWWAAVRGGFGGDGSSNDKGGLYRTTNRGASWTRVFAAENVESTTINAATHEMYVSTNSMGLWYGANFDAATPTFTQTNYPFRQPERVFINPNNTAEVWVTSFGYGLAVGGTGALPPTSTSVTGHSLFYNNSKFDNYTPGVTAADSAAIASDKSALLDGQTATFANFSSSPDGITGIFIDFTGVPVGPLTAADFGVKVGNSNAPAGWSAGPAPAVTLLAGSGGSNTARIALIWAAGSIRNQWAQVTVLANAHTNLPKAEVFYFGNAVGDATGDGIANATDYYAVRDHLRSYDSPAPIDWKWDFNRDGVTDAADLLIARSTSGTVLQLITLSPASVVLTGAKSSSFQSTSVKRLAVPSSRMLSGWRASKI